MKKKDKMTLDIAMYLLNKVKNHDLQVELYSDIKYLSVKEKKKAIDDSMECLICADKFPAFEKFQCCGQSVCEKCVLDYIQGAINGVSFSPIKCMLCKQIYPYKYIKWFLTSRKTPWRVTSSYKNMWLRGDWISKVIPKYKSFFTDPIYGNNLYLKFKLMIDDMFRCVRILHANQVDLPEDMKLCEFYESDLLQKYCSSHVFGLCPCFPIIGPARINIRNRFAEMIAIEKMCVNDENEEVVLNRNMFKCIICKSREEKLENVEIKKCPHCGVKTIKPNGCNFVICRCRNRWCFICNFRLPNSHEGHNVHFHIGRGTSAYNDNCRISVNYTLGPLFVLRECDCEHCLPRLMNPICANLDCNKIVKKAGCQEVMCKLCRAPAAAWAQRPRPNPMDGGS